MRGFKLVFLAWLAYATVAVAVDADAPPRETNCKVIDDNFGICDQDSFDENRLSSRENKLMTQQLQNTVRENENLYKELNEDEPPSESKEPDVDQPRPTDGIDGTGVIERGKRQVGEVSNCGERCFTYRPYWVFVSGRWMRVVQTWFFRQTVRWCWCTNQICSGRTSSYEWWYGRCRKERSWKRLLVWDRFWIRWVWVKIDNGCCCVPWNYA